MQNYKARKASSDVNQRTSPASATPKSTRVAKANGSESDTTSTHNSARISTERSPKVTERKSPRSPAEKKRVNRVSELESQITQLQEDLKKSKDQFNSSETMKRKAQQEADEANKQLACMTAKFEDSQRQLEEFSIAEEDRLQELRKISQERDRAWQSELEAVQRHHTVDNSALASAMAEMQRLKQQLDFVIKSEAAQAKNYEIASSELQSLKEEMAESLSLVDSLRCQMRENEQTETEAQRALIETQMQLEMANRTIDSRRFEGQKLLESFNSKVLELQQSQASVSSLEEMIAKFRNQDESELEESLKKAKAEIFDLKANLIDKETQLQNILEMNKELIAELEKAKTMTPTETDVGSKLEKLTVEIAELKASLLDKETELQSIAEENEILKVDIKRSQEETQKYAEVISELELTRASEKDVLTRLGIVTEEADKSSRKAARVSEQLDAANAVNAEVEAELRRLRVQSDQWRKAAEAAAAVLTSGGNGKFMDKNASLDTAEYNSLHGKLMGSPFSDELDDDSPKKKNVLRKIGGLWKKGPK